MLTFFYIATFIPNLCQKKCLKNTIYNPLTEVMNLCSQAGHESLTRGLISDNLTNLMKNIEQQQHCSTLHCPQILAVFCCCCCCFIMYHSIFTCTIRVIRKFSDNIDLLVNKTSIVLNGELYGGV